ncbi:MAG: aspartyl protease family protein [Candidatus Eisenbacteria bacterium]|nr:aspartyl protease family protein [Candidatus Eisenbacteria bacterium]
MKTLLLAPLAAAVAATAVAFAFVHPSPSHAAGDAWEPILARHIAWLGGAEALRAVRVITIAGRLEVSGLSGPVRSIQRRDGSMRSDFDLGIVKGSQGIGPQGAWLFNASGQQEAMGTDDEKLARREVSRSFGDPLLGQAQDVETSDLGTEEKDGKPWRVVRFTYSDGDTWDLFLDPEDGSQLWAREKRDTETIWHRYEDWRVVDGVRVPHRSLDLHDNPTSNQTMIVESISLSREDVPDSVFEAAPGAARKLHHFEGGLAATDWLPMTLHRGSYIYVSGQVSGAGEGVAVPLLLDSGAGMTCLDKAFAESLGVVSQGEVTARGTSGETTASFASGITIRVGSLQLDQVSAAVLDLSPIAQKLGRRLPVILGKEVFHALVVDVDYPARQIRFVEGEGFGYDGPGRRVPVFPAADGHKEIEISVEGLPAARVGLGTGSGAALDLFQAYVEENRLLEERPRVSAVLAGGVGGLAVEKLTSMKSVSIAGYVLPDVPTGIPMVESGAFATKRSAGNLGAGILKRFRVIFDYGHDCLWLEPRPSTETAAFDRDHTGLLVERKGEVLEVLFVSPGSPAEAGGWKIGDRIAALDGAPVGPRYVEAIDRFGLRPEGTVLRFTLDDGTERTLTLARYY